MVQFKKVKNCQFLEFKKSQKLAVFLKEFRCWYLLSNAARNNCWNLWAPHGRSWHDFAYPWAQRGKRRGPRTSGPSWASSWSPSLCGASCACLCGPLWAWRLKNKETNITLCDNIFLNNSSKSIRCTLVRKIGRY